MTLTAPPEVPCGYKFCDKSIPIYPGNCRWRYCSENCATKAHGLTQNVRQFLSRRRQEYDGLSDKIIGQVAYLLETQPSGKDEQQGHDREELLRLKQMVADGKIDEARNDAAALQILLQAERIGQDIHVGYTWIACEEILRDCGEEVDVGNTKWDSRRAGCTR